MLKRFLLTKAQHLTLLSPPNSTPSSLDLQLTDKQTTNCAGRKTHLTSPHPQRWSPLGLCPEPPVVFTVHI